VNDYDEAFDINQNMLCFHPVTSILGLCVAMCNITSGGKKETINAYIRFTFMNRNGPQDTTRPSVHDTMA